MPELQRPLPRSGADYERATRRAGARPRAQADSQRRRTDAGATSENDRRGMGEVQAPRRGRMGAGEDQGGP